MKKMKLFTSVLLATTFVTATYSLASIASANSDLPKTNTSKLVSVNEENKGVSASHNINVKFRQIMKVPSNATANELDELIPLMQTTGWEYNKLENIFERFVSYKGIEISLNNSTNNTKGLLTQSKQDTNALKTDSKGTVTIDSYEQNTSSLSLSITDPSSDMTFTAKANNNGEVVIDLDVSSMVDDTTVSQLPRKGGISTNADRNNPYWSVGELGYTGKRLHCNRFNGPHGDNRYYSHSSVQGLQNFVGSDCDMSFLNSTVCLADDIPGMANHCEAGIPPTQAGSKEATCSGDQGLSRYFHFR